MCVLSIFQQIYTGVQCQICKVYNLLLKHGILQNSLTENFQEVLFKIFYPKMPSHHAFQSGSVYPAVDDNSFDCLVCFLIFHFLICIKSELLLSRSSGNDYSLIYKRIHSFPLRLMRALHILQLTHSPIIM